MSDPTAPLVLEARGLAKCYGHVTALDGTDFEVRAGEIMAVIGDNGAGKSSLIKALSTGECLHGLRDRANADAELLQMLGGFPLHPLAVEHAQQ